MLDSTVDFNCGICPNKVRNRNCGLKCSAICKILYHYKCMDTTGDHDESVRKLRPIPLICFLV